MIQVDIGKGFQLGTKIMAYSSIYIGFNNRTQEYSEEFRFGLEAGLGMANQKLWLTGRIYGVESFKNGATAETITSTSIFANNSEYLSTSIEGSYYVLKNWGVSASVAGAFRGEIIAAAPSFSIGIFYNMNRG